MSETNITVDYPIDQNPEHSAQGGIHEGISQVIEGYQDWSVKHPFAATTAETVAIFVAKKAVLAVGKKAGLRLGNGHEQQQIDSAAKHPVMAITKAIIASPILEEVVFRKYLTPMLKQKIATTNESVSSTAADQASVLLFAIGHLGNLATKKGRENSAIPVSPFIGGENYQRLANTRGMSHAIGAHMLNNALEVASVAPIISRNRPPKSKV
jgi:membrane protease YdiL (CAAX protease family)